MDAYEATKVVFARIQALDPDHASKIMGVLLIQDHGEKDMIRLAFGPEHVLQSVVAKARADLGLKSPAPAVPVGPSWGAGGGGGEEVAFAGEEVGYDGGGGGLYPDEYGCWSPASGGHRRSYSLSDAEAAGGWKPCLYFARGYCKNGSTCRFLHGLPDDAAAAAEQELLMRAKAAAARSQLMATAFPFSPSQKGVNFLLQQQQQQQSESQRVAAAAALLLGGDDVQKYALRSPRMERADLAGSLANPGARQIYLTFPADSTFSEEDVSNYFSIYGPVQDVRIPYQQKRMFGFVTFVYPETVKLILAKGNPHFVCDARVLVKPYKEKGKVPDKFRKLPPPPHQAEFAGCTTPTGLLDSRDPFELPPPQIGPRMLYGSMASQEALLRRKLEEQQQVAELQQAIELQGRRFMGLQLIDVKNRNHHPLNSPIGSPIAVGPADTNSTGNANAGHLEDATSQDGKLSSGAAVGTTAASAAISAIAVEGKHEQQQEEKGNDSLPRHHTVNSGEGCPEPASAPAAAPNVVCEFQESGLEHNLPDSPFASPTKASIDAAHIGGSGGGSSNSSSSRLMASSLFPPTSTLDMASYNSCFLQMSRFSPGHGAIGM